MRYDPAANAWTTVYESPVEPDDDGVPRPRDRGVCASVVYQTAGDDKPVLYAAMTAFEGPVSFVRSEDGRHFQVPAGAEPGFGGDGDTTSVRCLAGHRERLYTAPARRSARGDDAVDDVAGPAPVFEAADPLNAPWRPVSEPAFGDPNNLAVTRLVAFDDHLYAATANPLRGYQVWKTDAQGEPPYRWTRIIDDGAWRGPASSHAAAMTVFGGALYVTSALPRRGLGGPEAAGLDRYGPFPAEMIRLYPDDSWELVTGRPRFTPGGLKRPVSGLTGGFGSRYTQGFWRFAEYRGWLYVATSDWRWLPSYLSGTRDDLTDAQVERLIADTEAYDPPEYGLWCSRDGTRWQAVTRTGFGDNADNVGIRDLVATPAGLFVFPGAFGVGAAGDGPEVWCGR